MDETATIPSSLEVLVTKDDLAIIGDGFKFYDTYVKVNNALIVQREDVDLEFNLEIDTYKVFEEYVTKQNTRKSFIRVPFVNTRLHVEGFHQPDDIYEFLNIERPAPKE